MATKKQRRAAYQQIVAACQEVGFVRFSSGKIGGKVSPSFLALIVPTYRYMNAVRAVMARLKALRLDGVKIVVASVRVGSEIARMTNTGVHWLQIEVRSKA